jgi:hypothetical protein
MNEQWLLEHTDDDVKVSLCSYAGGAHRLGHWGSLSLIREMPDGTAQFREFVATGPWKDGDVVAPDCEGAGK